MAALIVTALVGALTSWVVLRAKDYQALLPIDSGSFASEIEEVSYDRIPMLDRDSAEKLGDRKLGELADMVSQFEVAENYTQINYHGRPVRVTPLRYGDIIKWFNNRSEGLPAYLIIDMVTQNVEVVRLDEGMKYTTAEHFSRNLYRHLRFAYPTYMFEEPVFEINEDGTPYWVCAKKEKTIGLFGARTTTARCSSTPSRARANTMKSRPRGSTTSTPPSSSSSSMTTMASITMASGIRSSASVT